MKIKDVMTRDVITVHPDTPLKEAAGLLGRKGISGLVVVDGDGAVVGVLSEADILYKEGGERSAHTGLSAGCSRRAQPTSRRSAPPAPWARR